MLSISRSSKFFNWSRNWPMPGSIPMISDIEPQLADLLHLLEEVVEGELAALAGELAGGLRACSWSKVFSACSIRVITSPWCRPPPPQQRRTSTTRAISAATGLGGRARHVGGSAERARVMVRKAIATAIDTIMTVDPVVGRHLTTHIRTGLTCSYETDPDQPATWEL
ncbi:MAG: hypothetical protein WB797_06635 [Nocardioides sp.]